MIKFVGLGDLTDERQGVQVNAVWVDEAAALTAPEEFPREYLPDPVEFRRKYVADFSRIEVRRDPRGVIQGDGV